MRSIFRRNIIIAILLAWIVSKALHQDMIIFTALILPMLFMVLGIEESVDRVMESIHLKRFLKKLGNRKVLPPASKQD